jgi:hypothetical protein
MQWRQFSKLDEDGNWTHDTNPHALAVAGKASQTKMIWFMWETSSQPPLRIREGEYVLTFLFWDRPNSRPQSVQHKLFVSEVISKRLASYLSGNQSTTTDIVLDQAFSSNRLLTSHESRTLFHT